MRLKTSRERTEEVFLYKGGEGRGKEKWDRRIEWRQPRNMQFWFTLAQPLFCEMKESPSHPLSQ